MAIVRAALPNGPAPGKPVLGRNYVDFERKKVARFAREAEDSDESSSSSEETTEEEDFEVELDSDDIGPEDGRVYPQDNPELYPPDLEYPPMSTSLLPVTLEQFNLRWILLNRDLSKADELEPEKFIVFFGKRGTGKTFGMRAIAYMMQPFIPQAIIMTNTAFNGYWQKYFPSKCIWEGFDAAKLMDLIYIRQKYIGKWNKKTPEEQARENPYVMIIFEDCISSNSIAHAEAIRTLAANGRHLKVMVMITTQHAKGVGPLLRANTDYAFIYFQDTFYNKESLVEDYLSTARNNYNKNELITFLDTHTQIDERRGIRSVMVVDNMRQTAQLDRKIYTYSFSDPGEFQFGAKEWRLRLGAKD